MCRFWCLGQRDDHLSVGVLAGVFFLCLGGRKLDAWLPLDMSLAVTDLDCLFLQGVLSLCQFLRIFLFTFYK